mmetsp:Transcript_25824/g.45545  ORF Transcript_25824/g.45545 Transcript_25824/m.45545 type:complete len:706 (+) Transcript_25824:392-2509(+)
MEGSAKVNKYLLVTLMSLNTVIPIMRLSFSLFDIWLGTEVDRLFIAYQISKSVYPVILILLYSHGMITDLTALNITIEVVCINFLILSFIAESHLMLVWVIGYTYMVFLIQSPGLQSSYAYRFFVYLKPLVFIIVTGFYFERIELSSHHDVFALCSIFLFGYLASLVHNNELTKQQTIMKSLSEMKNQLDTILHAVPVGLLVINSEQKIVKTNTEARSLFSSSAESEIQVKLENLKYKDMAHSKHKEGLKLFDDICQYLRGSSEDLVIFGQIELNTMTLSVIGNRTTWHEKPAVVIVIKDVTEVIQLERTQSESQFKNVMLRSVSHELKTPTNGILHSVQAVASGEDVPEWAKKRLSIAEVSCKHLLMLIYDLLDYSQLIAGKFRLQKCLFNLRKTLTDSVELMRLIAEKKHIHLVTHIDPLLPEEVFSDANRLSQVLLNFLSNGVKFTPREGKIEVSAVLNNYCQMELSVSDTGVGIPPNQIDNLFKAFSRSDTTASINPQGVGLGLHISNMLAKQLGNSSVTVESKLAEGSRFKCIVNIYEKSRSSLSFYDEENPTVDDCMPLANKVYYFRNKESNLPRILVVDDSPFNRSVISDILNSVCIECAECDTGIEAIDYILSRAKRNCPIELVLMDFEMPLMNGPTTCKVILEKLKEQSLPVPTIIAHSAYSSEDDINLCKEAGMLDFLPKPSSKQEILAKLKLYL